MKKVIAFCMMAMWSVISFAGGGTPKVDVKLKTSKAGAVTITTKKNADCAKIMVLTMASDVIEKVNDEIMTKYMMQNKFTRSFTQDLKKTNLEKCGYTGVPNLNYTLLALPVGSDGNAGQLVRTKFVAPNAPLAGKPHMDLKVVKVGPDSVSVEFIPNKDVAGYAICMLEEGTADSVLQQHGSIIGVTNIPDMLRNFSGRDNVAARVNTWRELIPNTAYEFYAQGWDKNGRYMDLVKVPARTGKMGGTGEAKVDIAIGEFGGSVVSGYFQMVVYTPNDQAALHRDIIITEEAFNKADMGDEGVIKMLQTEAPKDPYWNQYRVDKAQWNAEPNTAYYACSMAKNANGEWGPLQKVRFVTPAEPVK